MGPPVDRVQLVYKFIIGLIVVYGRYNYSYIIGLIVVYGRYNLVYGRYNYSYNGD